MADGFEIDSLSIGISADAKDATKQIDNLCKSLNNLVVSLSRFGNSNVENLTNSMKDLDVDSSGIKKFADFAKKTSSSVSKLQDNFKNLGKDWTFSGTVTEAQKKLETFENSLYDMNTKLKFMEDIGDIGSKSYVKTLAKIEEIKNQISILKSYIDENSSFNPVISLYNPEDDSSGVDPWADREAASMQELQRQKALQQSLLDEIEKQKTAYNSIQEKLKGIAYAFVEIKDRGIGTLGEIGRTKLAPAFESFANSTSKINGSSIFKALSGIEKIDFSFKNLSKHIPKTTLTLSSFSKMLNRIGLKSFNNMLGTTIKKLSRTAKLFSLMVKRMLIRKVIDNAVQGFKNLVQFSSEVDQSVSLLWNSFKQLGNSLSAMVSPLIVQLSPAINQIIQLFIKATNSINQFISALSGSSTWTKAKELTDSYAESIEGAAKTATKSLAAFDKLNVLNSGSGSGSAETKPEDMFEEVPIENKFTSLADKIKGMFSEGEFNSIGEMIGNVFTKALDKIHWNEIQAKAKEASKNFANILNGFFAVDGLGEKFGKTIGEALNTVTYTVQSFVQNFDFAQVGVTFADSVNGIIAAVDWIALGSTLGDSVIGLLNLAGQAIVNINWFRLGDSISQAIQSVNWAGIAEKISYLFGAALAGFGAFLGGLFADAFTGIYNYFGDKIEECGGNVAKGILKGITDGLVSIGTWVYDHICKPFVDAFKKVFGIHSPSTVMAEMGNFLMEGLKNGISEKISEVIQKISDLFTSMKRTTYSAVNAISTSVKTIFGSMKDSVSQIFENMWNGIKTVLNWIIGGVEGMANGVIRGLNAVIGALNKLKIDVPDWVTDLSGISSLGFNIPILTEISIPRYEVGGFPKSGQLFLANEAGPELVGQMNGRTAVANHYQIEMGIAEAVKDAISREIKPYLRELIYNTGKGTKIEINGREVFRAVQDEAIDYFDSYGECAFPL